MFKTTKTDHGQQSLVLFPRTKCIIREGLVAIMNDTRLDSLLRDHALELKRHLEDPENEDKPIIFQKNHGQIINCPDCKGTGKHRLITDDHNEEENLHPCDNCKGEGQLYMEYTKKMYPVTEYHRRKLAQ